MATRDPQYPSPIKRRLQIYSLDPAADLQLELAMVSRATIEIPWEDVGPGPIGEYIEVIDYDPSSRCVYDPVELSELLAQNGLPPSTGNPQFHQQMVYAVAMLTISRFEETLGRRVIWAERSKYENGDFITVIKDRYVQRLRIYPHALRDQNAYYSPTKRSLMFGYFNAPTTDPRDELPGGMVFTCLSHDIIAHETTHAILDGIYPQLLDASNDDMLAFHEAFSDIVAIFQHFSLPGLLLDQIQITRGDLERDNYLVKLAPQFARSTMQGDALRNALGVIDDEGNRKKPDPSRFGKTLEPHERGAILVAAIFDAFLGIYTTRIKDLRRIATNGTGILPDGDIHPDLANRFAMEATKAASRVLEICIRAIDFLPPVDLTFGDYIRGLITADLDLYPNDPHRYRLAFIESFREHGIYPLDVRTLAEDTLRWRPSTEEENEGYSKFLPPANVLRTMANALNVRGMANSQYIKNLVEEFSKKSRNTDANFQFQDRLKAARDFVSAAWDTAEPDNDEPDDQLGERFSTFNLYKIFSIFLHGWINSAARDARKGNKEERWAIENYLGLKIENLVHNQRFFIHAVRAKGYRDSDGRSKTELVVVLTQRIRETLRDDEGEIMRDEDGNALEFKYRGGCTLIIDPEQARVRFAISKNLTSNRRKDRQAAFLRNQIAAGEEDAIARFQLSPTRASDDLQTSEPLAAIHGANNASGGY